MKEINSDNILKMLKQATRKLRKVSYAKYRIVFEEDPTKSDLQHQK